MNSSQDNDDRRAGFHREATNSTREEDAELELRPPLPLGQYPDLSPTQRPFMLDTLCRIYVSCHALRLGTETRFTIMVLFHRFAACHYAARHPALHSTEERLDTTNHASLVMPLASNGSYGGSGDDSKYLGKIAVACLFLGCKLHEEVRRIRDVINLSHMLHFFSPDESVTHKDPNSSFVISEAMHPPALDADYWSQKDEIVSLEQDILRMIRFDTSVCHPHRAVVALLDDLLQSLHGTYNGQERWEEVCLRVQAFVVKAAWKLLNGASFHPPALRYPVLVMSYALLWMALDKDDMKVDASGNIQTKTDECEVQRTGNINSKEGSFVGLSDVIASLRRSKWWQSTGVSAADRENAVKDIRGALSFTGSSS